MGKFIIMFSCMIIDNVLSQLTLVYHCVAPGLSFFVSNVHSFLFITCIYMSHSTFSQVFLLKSMVVIREGVLILLLF